MWELSYTTRFKKERTVWNVTSRMISYLFGLIQPVTKLNLFV